MWRRTIGLVVALGLGLAVRADEYGEDLNSVTDAVGVLDSAAHHQHPH